MLSVVNDQTAVSDGRSMLAEICREGVRRMLAATFEAEVDSYISELAGALVEEQLRLVTYRPPFSVVRTPPLITGPPRVDWHVSVLQEASSLIRFA